MMGPACGWTSVLWFRGLSKFLFPCSLQWTGPTKPVYRNRDQEVGSHPTCKWQLALVTVSLAKSEGGFSGTGKQSVFSANHHLLGHSAACLQTRPGCWAGEWCRCKDAIPGEKQAEKKCHIQLPLVTPQIIYYILNPSSVSKRRVSSCYSYMTTFQTVLSYSVSRPPDKVYNTTVSDTLTEPPMYSTAKQT